MTMQFRNSNYGKIIPLTSKTEEDAITSSNFEVEFPSFNYEHVVRSIALPTVIVDNDLSILGNAVFNHEFDGILRYNDRSVNFLSRALRNKFYQMQSSPDAASKLKDNFIDIFPAHEDKFFSKFLRLQKLCSLSGKNYTAISVLNLNCPQDLCHEFLAGIFGFTPAESKLANLMNNGISVVEAAEELGIRVSTVREHLSSLFAKTRTSRQPELISMLGRLKALSR
ncbi:helix-turn-helix transcriptional regulator [Novosphingobium sp. MW5]|nr:helix-turn-helix transcriptional regulator [Novosphingobium sp. MW5]